MRLPSLLALSLLAACNSSRPDPSPDPQVIASVHTSAASIAVVMSASAPPPQTRVAMPTSAPKLARSSNALGFDLWRKMPATGDAAMPPTSISVALAMALGGAKGATAAQLAAAMHLDGADPTAWGDISAALENRGGELRIANRLFAEKSYPFEEAFVRKTTASFRAPLDPVDFRTGSAAARTHINSWVADQTKHRIVELLGEGSVTPDTRLTLVNAIYLLADWDVPFEKDATFGEAFHLASGETKQTPTMHRTESMRSGAANGARIVDLPYKGSSLSMTVIVPDRVDGLAAIEASLSNASLGQLDKALTTQRTAVSLPKFTIDPAASLSLSSALRALGVSDAFDVRTADFTGIARPAANGEKLVLSDVVHKAFVKIDEKGTEAAAATAVIAIAATGIAIEAPPFEVKADRPFLFLIRDKTTGLVLFLGRVTDPKSGV